MRAWVQWAWRTPVLILLLALGLAVAPFFLVRISSVRNWTLDRVGALSFLAGDQRLRVEEIDRLDPAGLRLRNVLLQSRVGDDWRTWASIREVDAAWHPSDLLTRRIHVSRLWVSGLRVYLDSLPDPLLPPPSGEGEDKPAGPSGIPRLRAPSFRLHDAAAIRRGEPVYEAELDLADLEHDDGAIAGRIVLLEVHDWPDSLDLTMSGGRVRGRLIQSLHLDSLRISGPGLDGDLRASWVRADAPGDSAMAAQVLLRMDRILPYRIYPLRRAGLPVQEGDSVVGRVALDASAGGEGGRMAWLDLDLRGRLFGLPLDTLLAGGTARPDTAHLSSLRLQYGGLHAEGEAWWAPGRARARLGFSGLDLSSRPVALAVSGLPRSNLRGRITGEAGPLTAQARVRADLRLEGGTLAGRMITPLEARIDLAPEDLRAWIRQPPDTAARMVEASVHLDLESGRLRSEGRLSGGRLEELLGPWLGVEAGGRAHGPFRIQGGGGRPLRLEAELGVGDARIEGVSLDTLHLAAVHGTLDPLHLEGEILGRGFDAYGVPLDSLRGWVRMDDTVRTALSAWKDTTHIRLRARVTPTDPGIAIFDTLRVMPGSAPSVDLHLRPGLVFGAREVRIDSLWAVSEAGSLEGSGYLLPMPGETGAEPFAFRLEGRDLDFGAIADYFEFGAGDWSGRGDLQAEGSGLLGSPTYGLRLQAGQVETMDWRWESVNLAARAGEGLGVRIDSLDALGTGYFGMLPGVDRVGPQPIDAPVTVRIDSLFLLPDRPWGAALSALPDSLWEILMASSIGGRVAVEKVPAAPVLSPLLAPRTRKGPSASFAQPLDPMVQVIRVERPSVLREAARRPTGIAGRFSLEAEFSGRGDDPELNLQARAEGLRVYQAWADTVLLSARYADSLLQVDTLDWFTGGRLSRTRGEVPMRLVLDPEGIGLLPDSVDLRTELPEIDLSLASLVTSLIQDPQGRLSGNVRLQGVPPNLYTTGDLQVREGAFRIPGREERLSRVEADLKLGPGGIDIVQARGRINETGRLEAHGIYLDEEHFGIRATVRDAPVFETGNYRFTVDGDFLAQPIAEGDSLRPTVSGQVKVVEGLITLDLAKQAPGGAPPYTPWLVDLEVQAPGNLRVHQPTASVDLGEADLLVSFRWPYWNLSGSVQVLNGQYRIFNRTFQVTSGQVVFEDTGQGPNPILDVQADTDIPGTEEEGPIQVRIDVYGKPDQLDVALSSPNHPEYSQEQLIELLSVGQLGSPEFGSFSAGDPTRQYLEAELMSQVERQLVQQLPWVSRVQITGGLTGTEPVKINVRPIVQPQWSLNYSQELTSDPWREVSLNYRLSNLFFLNAAMDRREMDDGVPLDTYSLDLKLRVDY